MRSRQRDELRVRRHAERAEVRFRGLLEAAPDAVVCAAADGRIVLVNAQTERLFGYRRDELTGQPVEILVPEAARAPHPALRAGYLVEPQARPMGQGLELLARHRDGSTFPGKISLSTIDTGEELLVMAAVRDVTRQREATAAAARLAAIIQSSHDAVIGESLDRVITSWNPGAERLYGYSAAEMIGRHIEVLIPVARRAAEQDIQDVISRGGRVEPYQTERLRQDGSLIGVSIMLSPITDASGTITGVSRVSRDTSLQQRAEAPQEEWRSVREDIGQIERAAQRAAGLTRQLLAFARRDVVQPRPLNLNHAIEGVEQLLDRTHGAGQTVLVVEDEAAMREVTCRILARNGYQVITAVNGLDATEVAASHPGPLTCWSPTSSCRRCSARKRPTGSAPCTRP